MIENIVRHIEAGKPPLEAALDGAGEIGFTILSITLSLAAVFIPVLFMSGVVGTAVPRIRDDDGSRDISLRLRFADPYPDDVRAVSDPSERRDNRGASAAALESGFDRMREMYDRGLTWALGHQFPMLLVSIAMIALTVGLYVVIPKGFLPEQDTGIFIGVAQAREDAAFDAIEKIENDCAAIILKDPAVSGVVGFAGATGGNPSESTARMFVQLKPFDQRPSVQQVMARLKPERSPRWSASSSTCSPCRTSKSAHASNRRSTSTP